ncbi:hypothetical protein EXIGLDRAFT_719741 [Exidia glandulosa HHB12029]|uniref:Uncharacterized protein n=1 Tax=Exidia glandulosa HHB12029 TaxID=1314781 RepID=A0A166AE36_EXIGL|nr:hypothetical protein EXIGLDRAFT_719741 [Exidia glandulosa HHB12029]
MTTTRRILSDHRSEMLIRGFIPGVVRYIVERVESSDFSCERRTMTGRTTRKRVKRGVKSEKRRTGRSTSEDHARRKGHAGVGRAEVV